MSNSFFNFKSYLILIIFTILFICFIFIPTLSKDYKFTSSTNLSSYNPDNLITINSSNFVWPTPGYTTITSKFGKRVSPTAGASSFHSGIDIGAPAGTNIFSISDGKVIYTGFNGGGGYSIIIQYNDYKISYCHMSPIFHVSVNDIIKKGELIGNVGPKNVYGVPNNPYTDFNGNPTNGATTGCHLHLSIKKSNTPINPLFFFDT